MSKKILLASAILGATGVMIGAFGAHSLKPLLEEYGRVNTFQTAVNYHFYHALALLFLGILMHLKYPNSKALSFAALSWFLGITFFSGSLYTLSVTNLSLLGAVAPIGGVFFIVGWLLLFWGIKKAG